MSGHPLMRHGQVLVYPIQYECMKCHNTGYKNNDPSHPCSKCWEKYARPFTGPLVYAPWDVSTTFDGTRNNLQRPLRRFTPPHLSSYSNKHRPTQSFSGEASTSASPRAVSLNRGAGYPGASARVIPIAGGGVPLSPYLDSLQRPPLPSTPSNIRVASNPPPGATVVRPGDPRIGGRLCWRCGGSGTTTFIIFDEMPCSVCDGVGRTFD